MGHLTACFMALRYRKRGKFMVMSLPHFSSKSALGPHFQSGSTEKQIYKKKLSGLSRSYVNENRKYITKTSVVHCIVLLHISRLLQGTCERAPWCCFCTQISAYLFGLSLWICKENIGAVPTCFMHTSASINNIIILISQKNSYFLLSLAGMLSFFSSNATQASKLNCLGSVTSFGMRTFFFPFFI